MSSARRSAVVSKAAFAVAGMIAALAAVLASATPAVADTTVTLNATNQGRFSSLGQHSGTSGIYNVGTLGLTSFRNFFTFDLSSVSGTVTGATLTVPNTSCGATGGVASTTYDLWDVSSSAADLAASDPVSSPAGQAVFADLGTGTSYGSTPVTASPATVSVALSTDGLAALQAAAGTGFFAIGGSYSSTTNGLFLSSTFACVPTLTVTVADVVDTPMVNGPVLGGVAGLAVLVIGVVYVVRRRGRARTGCA
jgi:hypothetical protein